MAHLPVDNTETFAQWLLEEFTYHNQTVMLTPAAGFYKTPELGRQQVRLAYVLNQDDLNRAFDCLAEALRVYPGRTEVATQPALAGDQGVPGL
jgi:aspartate aminotransferase